MHTGFSFSIVGPVVSYRVFAYEFQFVSTTFTQNLTGWLADKLYKNSLARYNGKLSSMCFVNDAVSKPESCIRLRHFAWNHERNHDSL